MSSLMYILFLGILSLSSAQLSAKEKVCRYSPRPYICDESYEKQHGVCPPERFDATGGFKIDQLKKYTNGPWYVQYQKPLSYQPVEDLFCVRAQYDPLNVTDATEGLEVLNYANNAGVNGEPQTTSSPGQYRLLGIVPDPDTPAKLKVGPEFLTFLPNFKEYFGQYWVVAAGGTPEDPSLEYSWAIISGGPPEFATDSGCSTSEETLETPPDSSANPFAPLLLNFGFDNIKQLGKLMYESDSVDGWNLRGTYDLLDTIDLGPILKSDSSSAVEKLVDAMSGPLGGLLGSNLSSEEVVQQLISLAETQKVTISSIFEDVYGVDDFTLLLPFVPLVASDFAEELFNSLREGLVSIAERFNPQNDGLWLFTRDPLPSQDLIDYLFKLVVELGFDKDVLVKVEQEGCLYEGAPEKEIFFE